MWWFVLVLMVGAVRAGDGDDDDIQQAAAILVNQGATPDPAGPIGPDEEFVKTLAQSMELYNIKKTSLNRQGAKTDAFDETAYRAVVGPRSNISAPPESHKALKKVSLEGDMILTPDQVNYILTAPSTDDGDSDARRKREAQTNPKMMWNPSVPIPYYIDNSLAASRVVVNQAIQFWTQNTCLSFTYSTTTFNRLRIYKGSGCWSYVGKQASWASQDVSIGVGCDNLGTVCHEIAHALGFYHTQSRSDRDSYISVNYGNIQGSLQYNFQKLTTATEKHFGIKYDYGSVMQYDPYAFAVNYNVPTTIARDVNYQNMMGQRDGPSFSDVKQMNLLYNCAARCSRQPNCQNEGIVNSRTCNTCICPRTFAGNDCSQLRKGSAPNCNGQVLQATSSYASFTATVGAGMTYKYTASAVECYWHIRAPAGRRIQFQITSLDTNCMESCNWAGFEVNTGDLNRAGMLVCCNSINRSAFTSIGNIITIRGMSRYNDANMVINFRAV